MYAPSLLCHMVQRGAEMKNIKQNNNQSGVREKNFAPLFYNSNKAPAKSVAILRQ